MVDIVGRCEDVICETYDYVCYMSQYKKWKYDILGVVGKSALTYIGDLSTDGKGVIMGADCIDNAKVLIIDDTCYKGTTYANPIYIIPLFLLSISYIIHQKLVQGYIFTITS